MNYINLNSLLFPQKNGTLWKKTKSLLQHKETLPPLLREDSSLAVDDQDKAELLASHIADSFKLHFSLPSLKSR